MPGIFSRMFRRKANVENKSLKPVNGHDHPVNGTLTTQIDPWEKTTVRREDVVELLKATCDELKLRDSPLFLLPFRPSSDLTSTKSFIRRFFAGGKPSLTGHELSQELRLTDVLVLSGILRWVWTRLEGGIVGWEPYELFSKAERDCNYSRDAFNVLIPLSVESELHTAVILDFFAFMASVAAHAKSNGFAGQRLARIAGWYAFNVKGTNSGFVDGYANWEKAANATEHLFLAYLRSISPQPGQISAALPLSLSTLLKQTKYPPKPIAATPIAPGATSILRITLSVRTVSPTPFALLDRLARHSFVQTNPEEKGDALEALIEAHANQGDPTKALTPECLRVLRLIAATNESDAFTAAFLRTPLSLEDKTWTRFADLGFDALDQSELSDDEDEMSRLGSQDGASERPRRRDFLGVRPKTPSWGDFLVSGFHAEGGGTGFSLPPDKLLPPIQTSTVAHSSSRRSLRSRDGQQPFRSNLHELEKGEVKTVVRSRVDDALWSVWMESLCGEELEEKKAVFGRCVIAETNAVDQGRRWIVVEEIVKGAEAVPEVLPTLKGGKKLLSKKERAAKKVEEESLKKRTQQRRSTPDLISHHGERGSVLGREQRAQALAKQSATLRTIQEKEPEAPAPKPRRKSIEANTRPTVLLGADVSRAMKWADSYDQPKPEKPRPGPPLEKSQPPVEKAKTLPEAPKPEVQAKPAPPPPKPAAPEKQPEEIPREPSFPPKVDLRTMTPEPTVGPVLLSPESAIHRSSPEKQKSPPNKFKKFFNVKSKEEKAAKRASRAMSPLPPSPTPEPVKPQPPAPKAEPPRPMARTPEPRAPSPLPPEPKEWQEDFDGTHQPEPPTPSMPTVPSVPPASVPEEDYEPAPAPTVPIAPAYPKEDKSERSDDDDLDRWAQIRLRAGQRALHRVVAPPAEDDEITAVDIPRVRQPTNTSSPKTRSKIPVKVTDDEEEESVDARVARIRKRVQELTAGMGDD